MPMIEQLKSVSPDTAEAVYQAFHPACTEGNIDPKIAPQLVHHIQQLYGTTPSPVLKSYCLLFYGAVVDSNHLNPKHLTELSQFLSRFLAVLTDFRAKDATGHHVHFMNHATFLAQSIHDAGGQINWQPLLAAYLRADMAFVGQEDIVLADFLLEIVSPEALPSLLMQLKAGASTGAKTRNKRALWMAMKLLNQRLSRHNDSAFSELVDALHATVT